MLELLKLHFQWKIKSKDGHKNLIQGVPRIPKIFQGFSRIKSKDFQNQGAFMDF